MTVAELLVRSPLFAGLPRAALDGLAARATRRRVREGQRVLARGNRAPVLVLVAGRLEVVAESGQQAAVVRSLAPPAVVGLSVAAGAAPSAELWAAEDCELVAIPADAIVAALRRHPEAALAALVHLGGVVAELSAEVAALRRHGLVERVRHRLAQLGAGRRELRITHARLAEEVGGTRANVSRALASLEREGAIRRRRGRLELLALAPLLALAACGDSPSPPRMVADLSAVEPMFAPSATPIGDLVAVSYQLPADATPAAQAIRAFTESALAQAGIHHARADLLWTIAEPDRGAFDWSAYHVKVDGYASAGVTTLPILCYGNPWANAVPGTDKTPPDDPADFAAFAGAAATEFAGELPVYEIWNEENVGFSFWQPREQPDRYADLLAAAAAAIRKADPSAQIVFGGLLDQPQLHLGAEDFLQLAYRARGKLASAYDILAVHPYPLYPPAVAPEVDSDAGEVSEPRMIARLRAALAYWGDDPARPIWATEVGWPTYKTVDEDKQARWTVRSLLLLAGAGVDRVFVYTMYDGPDPATYPPEDAFGLFHYQDASAGSFAPSPKPAWTAIATLIAVAGPLAVTADVTAQLGGAPADAHAYQLAGPGARRVTAVWRTDDTAAPVMVTVPVTASSLEVVDMLGGALPASATIALSGAPVYVIENP